tara:strand:+ start:2652 stop:2816 length:165 start_codon:yes stop_codon:yes gene_type:complete
MTFDEAYEVAKKEASKKVAVWTYENRDDGEYVLHYATLDLLEKWGWNIEKGEKA